MRIKMALAGNPNSGKTTLFNALTGANQYVGNWPGVTVEKKSGKIKSSMKKGYEDIESELVDLPGIYSLSPYTLEEVVARNYILDDKPDVIINIIDGSNLERNLYLTTQLAELGIPMVLAVNMIDILKKNGDVLDTKMLEMQLGCPAVEISALKGTGIEELTVKAIETAKLGIPAAVKHIFSGSVEHALAHIEEETIHDMPEERQRFYAIKLFEKDEKIIEKLDISKEALSHIERDISICENEMDDDVESIITNERYIFVAAVTGACLKKKGKSNLTMSDKIDRIVTNRILGLPIFVAVMFVVYFVSVTTIGTIATDWTNDVLFGTWISNAATKGLESIGASDWVQSLVVDGIIGGIGAPIGFTPQMALVFLFLSFLEDCGYMARVAFIMDRIFRRFGLSGKSFIPFLISSGCAVPGIMATRTIENEKDRRMTIMTTTAIPCGAKLPVIAAIAGFLMGGAWWMAPLMYFVGIGVAIMSCIILKKMKPFCGKPAPFVMELPKYHIPSIGTLLLHTWERVWAFLKKAGTILFACCVVMWFLSSFGFTNGSFGLVEAEDSMMAAIGGFIAPIFIPLGFGTWQSVASSISGFVAKEGIISTMGVLSGLGEIGDYSASMHDAFASFFPTSIAAVSFLMFNLFDSPCLAAISSAAKEYGSKRFFWFAIAFQNIMAYCIALLVYQIGGLAVGAISFGVGTIVAFIILAAMLYMLFRPDPSKKLERLARDGNAA